MKVKSCDLVKPSELDPSDLICSPENIFTISHFGWGILKISPEQCHQIKDMTSEFLEKVEEDDVFPLGKILIRELLDTCQQYCEIYSMEIEEGIERDVDGRRYYVSDEMDKIVSGVYYLSEYFNLYVNDGVTTFAEKLPTRLMFICFNSYFDLKYSKMKINAKMEMVNTLHHTLSKSNQVDISYFQRKEDLLISDPTFMEHTLAVLKCTVLYSGYLVNAFTALCQLLRPLYSFILVTTLSLLFFGLVWDWILIRKSKQGEFYLGLRLLLHITDWERSAEGSDSDFHLKMSRNKYSSHISLASGTGSVGLDFKYFKFKKKEPLIKETNLTGIIGIMRYNKDYYIKKGVSDDTCSKRIKWE